MLASTLTPPIFGRELDEPTLDDALSRLWARLMGAREVGCPWCGGTMHPRYSVGSLPVGARCTDCGASLT